MVNVVVLQPGFLPWLGFFDQVIRSDVFIYYDDVQYDKHGWRNRNRIKSPTGEAHWLTVPVRHKGLDWPLIHEVAIDNTQHWARKHVRSLQQFYGKAPCLERYMPELERTLTENRWELLVDLDLALVDLLCRWMGLKPRFERSSRLGIGGGKSDRLLQLCRHFGATRYLSGAAAKEYLDVELFRSQGIEVEFQDYRHPTYPQLHGEFVPYLSAVDLLLNCGEESAAIVARGGAPARTDSEMGAS